MASYTGLYFNLILLLLLAYCLNLPKSLSLFMPMFLSPLSASCHLYFSVSGARAWVSQGPSLYALGDGSALTMIWKSWHYHNTKTNSPTWAISGFNPTAREEELDVCFLCTSIWIFSVTKNTRNQSGWRNQSDPEWFPLCPSWFLPTSPSRPGRCVWPPGDVQDA